MSPELWRLSEQELATALQQRLLTEKVSTLRACLPDQVSDAVSCLIEGGTVSLNLARFNDGMGPGPARHQLMSRET